MYIFSFLPSFLAQKLSIKREKKKELEEEEESSSASTTFY
jgi:hypothetical protein